jgi:hypothetical protein
MTAIFTLINTGMVNKLIAQSTLLALATGGIFDTLAPAGTTDNYVIFQITAGGDTNTSPRRDIEVIYRVEFISTVLATARTGAGYIDDALHDSALTVSGWSNYRLCADRLFSRDEMVAGKTYFRRGALYRVLLDKDG